MTLATSCQLPDTEACPHSLRNGAVFRLGADWGFSNDPTVLVPCFIGRRSGEPGASEVVADSKGRCLFVDYEAYAIGCPILDLPALFAGSGERRPTRWQNSARHIGIAGASRTKITADSAQPATIDYLQRRGFDIVSATKGKGSVEDGVNFLKTYDIYVHPRCRRLFDELVHYSWAIDKLTGEVLSRLADQNSHVIDALRCAFEGARRAASPGFEFGSAGSRVMTDCNLKGFLIGSRGSSGWGTIV